jgi:hypothetical protein
VSAVTLKATMPGRRSGIAKRRIGLIESLNSYRG